MESSWLQDCFGNNYRRMWMTGNGFCGFNSLSVCLTGTPFNYVDVIDDCVNVFTNCPQLFFERTNYGGNGDLARSVADYQHFMNEAIRRVDIGCNLFEKGDDECWCEDGHLAAISLLYDIAIFNYSTVGRKWFAFNEAGSAGYICLLSLPGHTDVLCGSDSTMTNITQPPIPTAVYSQCISRQSNNWTEAVMALQRPYPFSYIWMWPTGFSGVNILNDDTLLPRTGEEKEPEAAMTKLVQTPPKFRWYRCDVKGCSFKRTKNKKSFLMHRLKCHNRHTSDDEATTPKSSLENKEIGEDQDSQPDVEPESCTGSKVARRLNLDISDSSERNLNLSTDNRRKSVRSSERTPRSSSVNDQDEVSVSEVSEKQQCSQCEKYFVSLDRHKKCSGKLLQSQASISVENKDKPAAEDLEMAVESDTNKESRFGRTTKQRLRHILEQRVKDLKENLMSSREKTVNIESDNLYNRLKKYHDKMLISVSNTTTEKLTKEVLEVIDNPLRINDGSRLFLWSKEEEKMLNVLNARSKLLQPRPEWTWGAADDSPQGIYNDERMKLCVKEEFKFKVIDECPECKSSGILVGIDQIDAEVCFDCLQMANNRRLKEKQQMTEAWNRVKPASKDFPKRTEKGHETEDLPELQPGDKAVITPVFPVVTVKKNYFSEKKLRQESISLIQDPTTTWCKILPRTSLKDRYMVIERTSKNADKRYIVAHPDRVRQWLRYLFRHHKEFMRMKQDNELLLSEEAISALERQEELAEVDDGLVDNERGEMEAGAAHIEDGTNQAELQSGFTKTHVFSFDKYPNLYLKAKELLRIRKEGKIDIVEDRSVRKPSYSTSASLAFPHLYPNGELSPLDFGDYKLGRYLLKKQSLYSHTMSDGHQQYTYAADDIHMAFQYSRLVEMTVHATVAYYISQHPQVAHLPIGAVIKAFKDGLDEQGLLDSKLPDLTQIMTQLPHSRQRWYAERLGIEAMSRDLGEPNLFVTINLDPRASPDTRSLIYRLEHGENMPADHPFERNTQVFTELMNKYALQTAIYLHLKVKILLRAFLEDICNIPHKTDSYDCSIDTTSTGYYWTRVEFNETRGIQHYHTLVKLPGVLHTSLLGRMINNGRVVRQEMKCGNIKSGMKESAWEIIEMGLLASRYVTLFSHSISTASFYTDSLDVDQHDSEKVIKLEKLRQEFVYNYKAGNISKLTHPIMRQYDDRDCDPNQNVEMAKVAAVSCMHQCITRSCGGDPKSGSACRFDFPKLLLNHSVPAVMQINANQMEARILLRRTCNRVPNLNRYFLRYLRSNHDVSVLIDAAHSMRYATKYCAKGAKSNELVEGVSEHINKRSTDVIPPNLKQTLSHLVLADCSQRAFMSKQELAYKVMDLPDVRKSFAHVSIVGFYQRANLQVPVDDSNIIEYSDRTEYSAYAERCRPDSQLGRNLTKKRVADMTFDEFATTVYYKWVQDREVEGGEIAIGKKMKVRTRDVNSGHWLLTTYIKTRHTRPSTVLYTAPAIDYELVEPGKTTTQTTFFDLPTEKRNQLYRSYYELVMYVPWRCSPDETFLTPEVQQMLSCEKTHSELGSRHSLLRLEEFFKVYHQMWQEGKVAQPGSRWQRDNQYSYSQYMIGRHNRDVRMDRSVNKGLLNARYENTDELVDVNVDIRVDVHNEMDDLEFPSVLNFIPTDTFRDIMDQIPPHISEISVAFPLQYHYQVLEELVVHDKTKRFIAKPPPSPITYEDMTAVQQWAVDLGVDMSQKILYLCGKAGSGKTSVALKICEILVGKVQAGACTGKASSNFHGPTNHSMFGWSHDEFNDATKDISSDSRKIQELRVFYEEIEVFVIDEVNAMSAVALALLHDTMTAIFNPKKKFGSDGHLLPFGGKKMIFLGDPAQLRPVAGQAIYDDIPQVSLGKETKVTRVNHRYIRQMEQTKKGQMLYSNYMMPNSIVLQQSKRNIGLLGEICDRIREGKQTEEDLRALMFQRRRLPEVVTDYGIHYENDTCFAHNLHQLWTESSTATPPCRMYISKATYYTTVDNHQVIDGLASLPSKIFNYAPDVLCVSEGCEVRLVKNINVAAGLVNSANGRVIRVIYNNADVKSVLEGKNPPPYCIIVEFPHFQGFLQKSKSKDVRIYPFVSQPQWVPIYRQSFTPQSKNLPSWIRKLQLTKDCHRTQFPLDLASNITCHRAQGQTLSNCLVSVDLGLQDPDKRLPSDISSILYVACTRVNRLKDLFVSSIFPTHWEKIGKSDMDSQRRSVEEKLKSKARDFASKMGKYREVQAELAWKPDYSNNISEMAGIENDKFPPSRTTKCLSRNEILRHKETFHVRFDDCDFIMTQDPVVSERHIGLDQGTCNFGMAIVEVSQGGLPKIVHAQNYTNLELSDRFKVSDVVLALTEKTDILYWMQPANETSQVDRVVVHLEQIDPRNRHFKQFSIDLGRLLQQQAADPSTCIVKMSSPHIHRANGPAFRLGQRIIDELNLRPPSATSSKADRNPAVHQSGSFGVEPSSNEESSEYRAKKLMSVKIFRYIIEADEEKLQDMKIDVDSGVQRHWREKIMHTKKLVKLDDVGDALLHSLDEQLCGSTNFKQMVPVTPSLHNNRTVALAVFPSVALWAVLQCSWNLIILENFGSYDPGLERQFYKGKSTVSAIKDTLPEGLYDALESFEGGSTYAKVHHIKVVVKQLTAYSELGISRQQAGALTESTARAMREICDETVGPSSQLCDRRDKLLGCLYLRMSTIDGRKYQVIRSTGKHTNAMLCCLEWMKEHLADFVKERRQTANEKEKIAFFNALRELAFSDTNRVEMLQLGELVIRKLCSSNINVEIQRNLADLILIAINKNEQHIQAIASNSRQVRQARRQTSRKNDNTIESAINE